MKEKEKNERLKLVVKMREEGHTYQEIATIIGKTKSRSKQLFDLAKSMGY